MFTSVSAPPTYSPRSRNPRVGESYFSRSLKVRALGKITCLHTLKTFTDIYIHEDMKEHARVFTPGTSNRDKWRARVVNVRQCYVLRLVHTYDASISASISTSTRKSTCEPGRRKYKRKC